MKKLILAFLLAGVCLTADEISNAPDNARRFYKRKAIPTSANNECTGDCWVVAFRVTNTTSGALTVTVTDGAGSPQETLKDVSVAAKSVLVYVFPGGEFFPSGFKWTASGSGLTGYIRGANR